MITWVKRFPVYYGWINVIIASIAMTATLPGRTHGLGLITKPLLHDLGLAETQYGQLNFVSTILGALLAIPTGFFIDRFGVRICSTIILAFLSLAVLQMAKVTEASWLFLWLTLIRGFGQSALSVASMAMIGKWFNGRVSMAMGLYAVLLTFGFIGSILGMGEAIEQFGWRSAWQGLGWMLLAAAPLMWIGVADTPEKYAVPADAERVVLTTNIAPTSIDYRWTQAISTPAFWIVAFGTAAFNMVWSAITLFNESILSERSYNSSQAVEMMAYLTGLGLVTNIIAGKLATRERSMRLLGLGLLMLTVSLAFFPYLVSATHLRLYGSIMGCVGGLVTVVHFAIWGQFFGRAELGRIQAVAQLVSVLASASGPLILAQVKENTGSYLPCFDFFAFVTGTLAIAAWIAPLPRAHPLPSPPRTRGGEGRG